MTSSLYTRLPDGSVFPEILPNHSTSVDCIRLIRRQGKFYADTITDQVLLARFTKWAGLPETYSLTDEEYDRLLTEVGKYGMSLESRDLDYVEPMEVREREVVVTL